MKGITIYLSRIAPPAPSKNKFPQLKIGYLKTLNTVQLEKAIDLYPLQTVPPLCNSH